MPQHDFCPVTMFCERCGCSMMAVKDRIVPAHCVDGDNIVSIVHIIARKRFIALLGSPEMTKLL